MLFVLTLIITDVGSNNNLNHSKPLRAIECAKTISAIRPPFSYPREDQPTALGALSRFATAHIFPFAPINRIHSDAILFGRGDTYADKVLDVLNIKPRISDESLSRLNIKGPVVFLINHSNGLLDPLVAYSLIHQYRPDLKIMTNEMVASVPELRGITIPVDILSKRKDQIEKNLTSMKVMLRHLKRENGALLIAPSGEVAHRHTTDGPIVESPWLGEAADIALRAEATVVNVHIDFKNSDHWNQLGLWSPKLRTYLLPSEVPGQAGVEVPVTVGEPKRVESKVWQNPQQLAGVLRAENQLLSIPAQIQKPSPPQEIAAPIDSAILKQEIDALDESHKLYSTRVGNLTVYLAKAREIPNVLNEIGALRERVFRPLGEGSGKSRDLDEYDDQFDFDHLFVWNGNSIVAAYRIGKVDENLRRFGPRGIYASKFFKIDSEFWRKIPPALELGRAVVRKDYQNGRNGLPVLFNGLAEFLSRNPKYGAFIGTVSMSGSYKPVSQQIVPSFYKFRFGGTFMNFVKPNRPATDVIVNAQNFEGLGLSSPEDLEKVVRNIEQGSRGVPQLFNIYSLGFGAKYLAHSFDPEFNSTDVLEYADIREAARSNSDIYDRLVLFFNRDREKADEYLNYDSQSKPSAQSATRPNKSQK